MSGDPDGLGGRLALHRTTALDEAGAHLVDEMETYWVPRAEATPFRCKSSEGQYIGPFNPFLYSPDVSTAFIEFQKAEANASSLSARMREVVILSVGSVWQAEYEIYAHSAAAAKAGFTTEEVADLAAGRSCATLSAGESLAQAAAIQLTRDRRIDGALYEKARAAISERGLVDLVTLTGCYHLVCALLNAFEIPAPTSA